MTLRGTLLVAGLLAIVAVAVFSVVGPFGHDPPKRDISANEMARILAGPGAPPGGPLGVPGVGDPEADAVALAQRREQANALRASRGKQPPELSPVKRRQDFPLGSEPTPGSNKAIGKKMLEERGWADHWGCLEKLWDKESHWHHKARNPSSGAYGIAQALPGSKMASAGADWETNPATQIKWGLGYIAGRYGKPCDAWAFFQSHNWY